MRRSERFSSLIPKAMHWDESYISSKPEMIGFPDALPGWLFAAYWVLMVLVLISLISAIRVGLDRNVPMSRTRRAIRVVGGSIWAAFILVGLVFQWERLR
jgi:hypothetical protein